MPRKRGEKTADFYAVFPERLREIMQAHGTTQQEIAEYVGKSRQAIGYYADGSSTPDWQTLAKLATYFGISTDWLLGLADAQSIDFDIQRICKYTGLSEESIKFLSGKGRQYIDAINVLLGSRESVAFAAYLFQFLMSAGYSKERKIEDEEYSSLVAQLCGTDHTLATRAEAKSLYLQNACDVLRDIMRHEDIRRRFNEEEVSISDI